MKDIYQRLDEILHKICEPNFRANKGLGNEIGFYIFDYNPEYELLVRDRVKFIKEKAKATHGLNIVEFDLYEVILEILDSKGYLKKNFQMEEKRGSEVVFTATKKALRLTLDNDLVVEYIKDMKLTTNSTLGIQVSMVTSGGVSVKEINSSTMESKLIENLYFTGEVIDVDAETGGYNLQIAFSTGYLAGISI